MRDKQANSDARHVIGVRRVVPHHHNVLKNTPYRSQDLRHDIHAMTIIRHAIFPEDTAAVLSIWREFIANSPVNLDYQNNDAEFANLPGKYAPPNGCVLLADREGEFEGCVAMRQVIPSVRDADSRGGFPKRRNYESMSSGWRALSWVQRLDCETTLMQRA